LLITASLTLALGCSGASLAPQAAVEQCDELAAHPHDPRRLVKEGVDDDRIAAGAAIPACQRAAEVYPDEARFAFQLGRALLAAGQTEEATAQFTAAAEKDYAPAYKYLGDLVAEQEPSRAKEQYTYAAAHGFSPAGAALEELELSLFKSDLFADKIMTHIHAHDFSEIDPLVGQIYLSALLVTLDSQPVLLLDPQCKPLVNALVQEWGIPITGVLAWVEKAIKVLEDDPEHFGKNLVEIGTILLMRSTIKATAEKDTIALVSHYGCQRAVTKRVYDNTFEFLTKMIVPAQADGQQTAAVE
jgi:tetratricopeptide (TPR) repeat protein